MPFSTNSMTTPCHETIAIPGQVHDPDVHREMLHIACVADERYGSYAGITFFSVIRANREVPVHLHLFSDGVSRRDIERIQTMASSAGAGCSIYDVATQLDRFPYLTGKFHYSRATYGRLFIADLLPNDIDWVIYLDCDILCVGSLSALWNRRQSVATAAAVSDVWVNSDRAYKESVGCDPNSVYYNCGVMLINVREWRARRLFPALIDFLHHNPSLRYVDQDAVNAVLGQELLELEPYWNVFISAPDADQVTAALDAAVNIHYCAALKPWHLGYSICGGVAGDRYRATKAISPWRWQLPDPQIGRLKKRIREKIGSFG